jgi:hypothetical protein
VYITWENENETLLFYSDPFRVMTLDLQTGMINSSDLKYIANYDQELDIEEIIRL